MRSLAFALLLVACSSDGAPSSSSVPVVVAATDAGHTEAPSAIAVDSGAPVLATTSGDDDDNAPPPVEHSGDATYYAATSTGACGIKTPSDKLVAAVGTGLYSKDICGQCAEVTGPNGSVVVLLNDRCVGCKGGGLDLATQAFVQIASKSAGRVKITWHLTDCP